jgi:hypothetical protein
MNREKIVDYLDKQFWKHKVYECMPENETGYEYIPRESLTKIVDGLIPLVKAELKNCSIPDVSSRRELLLAFVKDWYKDNPLVSEEKQASMVDKWLASNSY